MPAVLLIRHGQASFGTADYDVPVGDGRETGRGGPRRPGGARDRGRPLRERVAAAPARHAQAVERHDGVNVEIDPRWNEYGSDEVFTAHADVFVSPEVHDGAPQISSRQFQELVDPALLAWVEAGDDSRASETWPMFRDRVAGALRDLAGSLGSGETAAVATSGGPIAAICSSLLGVPDTALVAFNRVTINAGITKVTIGRGGTTLVSFNEHAHLEPGGLVTYR